MEQKTLGLKPVRKRVPKAFKMSMFIDKIGIEFEGGWDKTCTQPWDSELSRQANIDANNHEQYCSCLQRRNVHDGSVSCSGSWSGEVPVGPSNVTQIDDMFKCYPEYGNRTCGMHLHVSFKRQYYYRRLMDPEFFTYFKDELMKWGERVGVKNANFFSRLRGENNYCKNEWLMEAQVNTRDKDSCRYAILNYCYNLHKTLEVRVLPYFKSPEMAKSAVLACLNIICDWLYQHRGKRPADARASVTLDAEFMEVETLEELEVSVSSGGGVVERSASRTDSCSLVMA